MPTKLVIEGVFRSLEAGKGDSLFMKIGGEGSGYDYRVKLSPYSPTTGKPSLPESLKPGTPVRVRVEAEAIQWNGSAFVALSLLEYEGSAAG